MPSNYTETRVNDRCTKYEVLATGDIVLGEAAPNAISTYLLHVNLNGGTLTFVINARAMGSGLTSASWFTPSYQKISASSPDQVGGTAITTSDGYWVRADLCDIILTVSVITGAPTIHVTRGIG